MVLRNVSQLFKRITLSASWGAQVKIQSTICTKLGPLSEIRYEDIFGTTVQQIGAVSEFLQRCSQRSAPLAASASQGLQGQVDTSTLATARGDRTSTGDT